MNLAYSHFEGPLGSMLLAATPAGLAGVWFVGQQHMPDTQAWQHDNAHPVLAQAALELTEYFAGQRRAFTLALTPAWGTPFQRAVWQALAHIGYGQTTRYGALAAGLGRPQAARAAGAAVGRNPLSVVLPCHRVLGHGGALTGYAGGTARKAALLKLEGALGPEQP